VASCPLRVVCIVLRFLSSSPRRLLLLLLLLLQLLMLLLLLLLLLLCISLTRNHVARLRFFGQPLLFFCCVHFSL